MKIFINPFLTYLLLCLMFATMKKAYSYPSSEPQEIENEINKVINEINLLSITDCYLQVKRSIELREKRISWLNEVLFKAIKNKKREKTKKRLEVKPKPIKRCGG